MRQLAFGRWTELAGLNLTPPTRRVHNIAGGEWLSTTHSVAISVFNQ